MEETAEQVVRVRGGIELLPLELGCLSWKRYCALSCSRRTHPARVSWLLPLSRRRVALSWCHPQMLRHIDPVEALHSICDAPQCIIRQRLFPAKDRFSNKCPVIISPASLHFVVF